MKPICTWSLLAAAIWYQFACHSVHAADAPDAAALTAEQWERQGLAVSHRDGELTRATIRALPTADTIRLLQNVDSLKEIAVSLEAPADGEIGILDSDRRFGDEHLRLLCRLTQIESLNLDNTGVTAAGFAEISALQNLRSLILSRCDQLTDAAMSEIVKLPSLVELHLARGMTDMAVQVLLEHPQMAGQMQALWTPGLQGKPYPTGSWSRLAELRSLTLVGEIATTTIDEIVTLPRLQSVNVAATRERGNSFMSDENVRKFAALPELVSFAAPLDSTGYVLQEFADCPKLRELTIGQRSLLFPSFGQLTQLERLRIAGYRFSLSSSEIAAITNLTNLKHLSVSGLEDNDGLIARLTPLAQLEDLYLHDGTVSAAGLGSLADLPRLENLSLPMDQVFTDEHFRQIAQIRSLRKLFPLDIPQVTDDGIAALTSLPDLEKLAFFDARQLTDACLPALARMSKLTGLYIDGCEITPEGTKQLQSALPYTQINIEESSVVDDD